MATSTKVFIAIIGAALVLATILIIFLIATGFVGRPKKYAIAESFSGWATISYGNPSCKALEDDGLFLVIRVDESGKGCTSSPMPQGWRYTKYVHVGKDGEKSNLPHSSWEKDEVKMVWAGSTMTPQGGYPFFADVFFVGTSEQLKAAWSSQPR